MSEQQLKQTVQDLQVLVAFQERALADLNEVVLGFTARVERLENELLKLRDRVDDPLPEVGPQDDPPPHY